MKTKYTVFGYCQTAVRQCGGRLQFITEYSVDCDRDTLAEAKKRAKHFLSEEYRILSESSQRLAYATVIENKTGDCVADFQTPESVGDMEKEMSRIAAEA